MTEPKTKAPPMTDSATLLAMADHIAAASGAEQREWLEQAFYALNEAPDYGTPDRRAWVEKSRRFRLMLHAEAYESAAMVLVPEGWRLDQLGEWYDQPLRASGPWLAILISPQYRMNDGGSGGPADPFARCTHAATPALALTAASLRACAAMEGEG